MAIASRTRRSRLSAGSSYPAPDGADHRDGLAVHPETITVTVGESMYSDQLAGEDLLQLHGLEALGLHVVEERNRDLPVGRTGT